MDSAHQKAACELIPNSESPQALLSVRAATLRQRWRTRPLAVGTGPVPSECQASVYESGSPAWVHPGCRTMGLRERQYRSCFLGPTRFTRACDGSRTA